MAVAVSQRTLAQVVILKFNGAITISHAAGSSGSSRQLLLGGGANYSAGNNGTLTLFYDAAGASWREVGRATG